MIHPNGTGTSCDSNADRPLLLGTLDWQREDWLQDYYPPDLPPEWRLSYYTNDCSCVLLKAASWADADPGWLAETLDEPDVHPVYFLELPLRLSAQGRTNLALFTSLPAVLLVDRPDPAYRDLPQWSTKGPGCWVDKDGAAGLLLWSLATADLRGLRARAEQLPESLAALVLDGPGANPGRITELRTLLELMGKA